MPGARTEAVALQPTVAEELGPDDPRLSDLTACTEKPGHLAAPDCRAFVLGSMMMSRRDGNPRRHGLAEPQIRVELSARAAPWPRKREPRRRRRWKRAAFGLRRPKANGSGDNLALIALSVGMVRFRLRR